MRIKFHSGHFIEVWKRMIEARPYHGKEFGG